MEAGDGLLVRIRPRLSRLSREQVLGLCEAASQFGNGVIDATNRASLQIRGVQQAEWPALMDCLVTLGLVDDEERAETRRNVLVAPDWRDGDDSALIATMMMERSDDLPNLPAKMAFAVDAGPGPILGAGLADFMIERGESGGLILRAEGRERGVPVERDRAADAMVAFAHWFVESGGREAGRMARHTAPLPSWAEGKERSAPLRPPIHAGEHSLGMALGVVFGGLHADGLATLVQENGAQALRVTPWRILLLEGASSPAVTGGNFILDAEHPALRVDACPGAPFCAQASVQTRALALRLAPYSKGRLHVSGCAKGCARSAPADTVLTGRDGLFNLAFNARAGDAPALGGLGVDQLLAHFGVA